MIRLLRRLTNAFARRRKTDDDEYVEFVRSTLENQPARERGASPPDPEPERLPAAGAARPTPSIDQARPLAESIAGIGPVLEGRLMRIGITDPSQLVRADPKMVAVQVQVREEIVVDWIRQAVGLSSHRYPNHDP